MRFRSSAVALAVSLLWGLSAGAQDLTLRAFGGPLFAAQINGDLSFQVQDVHVRGDLRAEYGGTAMAVGGAAGVTIGRFALEGELGVRRTDGERGLPGSPEVLVVPVDSVIVSGLASAWYNAPVTGRIVAYGGGGLGVADETEIGDLDIKLAWQLGAGLRYRLSDKVTLGAGYRYFRMADIIDVTDADTPLGTIAASGDYSDSSLIAEVGYQF